MAQDLGFVWGPLQRGLGGVRDRGGEGTLSTIGRGSPGGFEAYPGTPVPSPRPVFLVFMTEGKHPRDNRGHDR